MVEPPDERETFAIAMPISEEAAATPNETAPTIPPFAMPRMPRQLNSYLDLARIKWRSEYAISAQFARLVQEFGVYQARGDEKPRWLIHPGASLKDSLPVAVPKVALTDDHGSRSLTHKRERFRAIVPCVQLPSKV